jgi:hypothetical protein
MVQRLYQKHLVTNKNKKMKKLIILLVVIMGHNTTIAQQIKDLKYYYTDNNKYSPSDFNLTRIYYKDINNYFTPFLGQWKSTTGNQTFVLTLWKETQGPTKDNNGEVLFYCDNILGHYAIYQDYGLSTQIQLFTSQINIGNSTQIWPSVFSGKVVSSSQNVLNGGIYDVNATPLNPTKYPQGFSGLVSMTINNTTTPPTAQWRVIHQGITRSSQPRNFVIPTDVTLIKM